MGFKENFSGHHSFVPGNLRGEHKFCKSSADTKYDQASATKQWWYESGGERRSIKGEHEGFLPILTQLAKRATIVAYQFTSSYQCLWLAV